MIKICDNKQQEDVLGYIGDDYPKCLYLYLDIIKYGCSSETTRTWIQYSDGEITAVALAYHTALHIFSRNNDLDSKEVSELVKEIKPTIVISTAETIKIIEPTLTEMGFLSEFGHIGEWMGSTNNQEYCEVVEAEPQDIPEIAKMLYEDDDIGTSYVYEDLLKQMQERLDQGFVRSYVIRKDGKPIAHVGTGAETQNVCTIAYTITSHNYRGQGLARKLYNQACGILKKEGKRIFSVYYPESARTFHHKVEFIDVCECGKLYRIVK